MRCFDEQGYPCELVTGPWGWGRNFVSGPDIDILDYGPGLDLVISRAGNVILLFAGNGDLLEEFDATGAGLTAAIAAAISGDRIELPQGSIGGDYTVPAGVTLEGHGPETILTGQITLGAGVHARMLKVARDVDQAAPCIGILTGDLTGAAAWIDKCIIEIENATGDAIGVATDGVQVWCQDCFVTARGGGDGYGFDLTNRSGWIEGGTFWGSTAPLRY